MISLAFFRLQRSHAERAVTVFAVIHVTQIHFVFTREEKLMWRREHGQRSAACIYDGQPVSRAQADGLGVRCATELILLPGARRVAPHYSRMLRDVEAFQT